MILHRYVVLLVGVAVVSFCGSTWFAGNGDAQFPRFPEPSQLFPSVGKVVEISDGSMEKFTDVLQQNGVNAVLFYAPWCGQSSTAAQEFNRAAKMLYKEVAFLQSIIRPFLYIGTNVELNVAKTSNQELVISYFNQPLISNKNYTTFLSLTLQFRMKDSRPTFAVVTSTKLALKAGMNNASRLAYHRLHHDVLNYPSRSNFTVEDITTWIDANRYELVVQLTLSSDRKGHVVHHLSRGPALILFLPMKLHMSGVTQQLLDTYIYTASLYFNCSCNGTTKGLNTKEWSRSQNSEANQRDNTSEKLTRINVNRITSATSQFTLFDVANKQEDVLVTGKEWNLPFLLAYESTCQSLLVPKQGNLENKRNICDVCHTCHLQKCQRNIGPGLGNILSSDVVTALPSLRKGCSTFRPNYYSFAGTMTICCTGQTGTTKHSSSLKQIKNMNLESIKKTKSGFDDLFGELVTSVISPVKTTAFKKHQHKDKPEQVFPVQERYDSFHAFPGDKTSSNSCTATGHVTNFTGAGCHSNRSVRFFIMDSTEYWGVAEKLGVLKTLKVKAALVIADLQNDAQFVLDEDLQINNSSIVEFVMAYMAGNLTRRFRSSRASSRVCVSSQACIVEVVSSNFQEIVLDETKDVLLLYHAPWCGYCQALEPVLLTVAKFFQSVNDVTIGRINADENDLPWELYVPQYPSFVLFPAHRKEFSVRFPDSMERTTANIVHFLLDHGVRAGKVFDEFVLQETVRDQINEVESFLCQVEEKKRMIEGRLWEAVWAKELWYHRRAVNLKSLHLAKPELDKERELRLASEYLNKILEQQQQQVEEKVVKLTERSTDVLNELVAFETKLNQKQKLLTQLSFESRNFVLENGQFFSHLRKTEMALQNGKKVVLEIKKSLMALRRRAIQLEFSISILRTQLNNLT